MTISPSDQAREDILSVALSYIVDERWAVVPIAYREKAPKGPMAEGWQKLRIGADDASRYFNGAKQNIGVILGEASHGLTDIDLDCDEAVRAAPYMLPKTRSFGREFETRKPLALCYRPVAERDQGQAGLR